MSAQMESSSAQVAAPQDSTAPVAVGDGRVDALVDIDTTIALLRESNDNVMAAKLEEIRAAFAELIAAVEAYREADNEVATNGYGRGERLLHAKIEAALRVDAALAACGGSQ